MRKIKSWFIKRKGLFIFGFFWGFPAMLASVFIWECFGFPTSAIRPESIWLKGLIGSFIGSFVLGVLFGGYETKKVSK